MNVTDKCGDGQLVRTQKIIMDNIIKRNWPPAFLSSYLNGQSTVTRGKEFA